LFNLAGYPLLFGYLSKQSVRKLTTSIEHHDYKEAQLVEVKVKLNLPYLTSQEAYENLEGDITINDHHYNYVKRKVCRDTLYLVCLPNALRDELQMARADYGETASDAEMGKKAEHSVKKGSDWQPSYFQWLEEKQHLQLGSLITQPAFYSKKLSPSFSSRPDIPPEFNS